MSMKVVTTGQDSFLDIVANLVGVLIILVVLVGAQARSAWDSATPLPDLEAQLTTARLEIQNASDHVRKLEVDNENLEREIDKAVQHNLNLASIRQQLLVQAETVQRQITEAQQQRADKLSAEEAERLRQDERQRQLEIELEEINTAFSAVAAASQSRSEVIDHYPNPIAKTVFADEIHFQLKAGRLVYVPLEELVSRMKSEWKVKAEKLAQAATTLETVGPIDDFRLQYELATEIVKQPTELGIVERRSIRFDGFSIVPNQEDLGEPVAECLTAGSAFQQLLQRYSPGKTTISIWIYPDSYPAYNQLKPWLYERGYQIACWPLDHGKRISGGPSGLRSSAQ